MASSSQLSCLIAAGGTAGHVLPALAVAEALRDRGVRVSFAGTPDRIEARLVPKAGFAIDPFRVSGLPRRPGPAQIRSLAMALRAVGACARILERRRPDVVLGAGGYVAGPMVLAAWRRRIPVAVTEVDAHLGLTNRLAARIARRVFLAYPIAGRDGAPYRVVGRPLRRQPQVSREEARRVFVLPAEGDVLLVFGGSQGAATLNELVLEAFADSGPAVLHLCGERYYEALRDRPRRSDYRLLAWTDEFGAALTACDLVLGRSGSSVWEVAAAGRPAVLVPSPNVTADHQTLNARYFDGGAVVVPEHDLDRVPGLVRDLLADRPRLEAMGRRMRELARPDAADEVAAELIALAAA